MLLFGLVAIISALGCGGGKKSQISSAKGNENIGQARLSELPLPDVPNNITDPSERASYAVSHFWDALDVADHSLSLDSAFMEQTFANFVGLLPYAPDGVWEEAIGTFVKRCAADPQVYDLAAYIARHYLDDPNSPMRNEELYIPFLRLFAADSSLSEAVRERSKFRLEQALKNRPGMKATDFRMVMRDGRNTTLLRELGDTTIVLFYDYDCEHCKETVGRLQDPATGIRFPIMAVEATEEREGWDATKGDMPAGWKVGFATEPLDGESYYFPALPSVYLLSGDGTVIVKDGVI